MTPDQLMRMTIKDLRALAERHGVEAGSKLRKDQLIGLLAPLLATTPRPEPVPAPSAPPAGSSTLAAASAPAPSQGPNPGLPIPDRYGIDRIVLLVQDPQHLYAYWEIDAATFHRVASVAGDGCTPVLLIDMPHGTEAREVDLRSGNYYINVGPGGTFRARLALRGRDGRLHALAADSNVVSTPAMAPSQRQDEAWMEVDEHFHDLLARAGGGGAPGESSLNRLTKRTLSAREVALGSDDSDFTTDLTVDVGDMSAADRTSASLSRRVPGDFSSHSLLSSGSLSSFHLSSHTLSSHSLSSGVFSSHSRWTQVPAVDLGSSPGLTQAPVAANPAPATPMGPAAVPTLAAPAPSAPPAVAATVTAPPLPRPGQIKGADTVKRSAPRRRP